MKEKELREAVRERYGSIARQEGSCCAPNNPCCGEDTRAVSVNGSIGYSQEEMSEVPEGSNLGLGCGNPLALASLRGGETVLDLGSGAGFDCFLASKRVGPEGRIIGVDMTPEMVEKARENAADGGYTNVEFRLGEIENLPVADASVDLVISNCVINLSVDKARVFQEAYRVLKSGGKLMVSDIVITGELPKSVRESIAAYTGCLAGASQRHRYLELIEQAGFKDIKIESERSFGDSVKIATADDSKSPRLDEVANQLQSQIISISVTAVK